MPFGSEWRKHDQTNPAIASCPTFTNASKTLVLLRDPVDTMASTLSRFWRPSRVDTLMGELVAHLLGWRRFAECLKVLRCDSSLILSYELLSIFPDDHLSRIASFIGTAPTDARLIEWLGRIWPPGSHPDAMLPRPLSCSSSHDMNIAAKLHSQMAQWRENSDLWAKHETWVAAAMARFNIPTFSWPRQIGNSSVWPQWALACSHANQTSELQHCVDSFRAEFRAWVYSDMAVRDALPRQPCAFDPVREI